MADPKLQLCSIRIMISVESDEEAIDYKKKVEVALSDKPDAQIQFMIMPIPKKP